MISNISAITMGSRKLEVLKVGSIENDAIWRKPYGVSFQTIENGSIKVHAKDRNVDIPSGGLTFYEENVEISIVPDSGYRLKTFKINNQTVTSPYTLTSNSDIVVIGETEPDTYWVDLEVDGYDGNCSITGGSNGKARLTATYGDNVEAEIEYTRPGKLSFKEIVSTSGEKIGQNSLETKVRVSIPDKFAGQTLKILNNEIVGVINQMGGYFEFNPTQAQINEYFSDIDDHEECIDMEIIYSYDKDRYDVNNVDSGYKLGAIGSITVTGRNGTAGTHKRVQTVMGFLSSMNEDGSIDCSEGWVLYDPGDGTEPKLYDKYYYENHNISLDGIRFEKQIFPDTEYDAHVKYRTKDNGYSKNENAITHFGDVQSKIQQDPDHTLHWDDDFEGLQSQKDTTSSKLSCATLLGNKRWNLDGERVIGIQGVNVKSVRLHSFYKNNYKVYAEFLPTIYDGQFVFRDNAKDLMFVPRGSFDTILNGGTTGPTITYK